MPFLGTVRPGDDDKFTVAAAAHGGSATVKSASAVHGIFGTAASTALGGKAINCEGGGAAGHTNRSIAALPAATLKQVCNGLTD